MLFQAIGSYRDHTAVLSDAGSTYVFSILEYSWEDLGASLGGTVGEPLLVGEGTMYAGDPITLSLTNARPWSLAYFVISLAELNHAPFYGGTLVPDPAAPNGYFIILNTLSGGSIELNGTWPTGAPTGTELFFQYWIHDSAGPYGFAASNALRGVTP